MKIIFFFHENNSQKVAGNAERTVDKDLKTGILIIHNGVFLFDKWLKCDFLLLF